MNFAVADEIIDRVFDQFLAHGHKTYGESVTELEHALQCATFAVRDGKPNHLVAACLLHDYGHLCHDLGEDIALQGLDAHHEELGAALLSKWFPPAVVEPGRLHVAAKRYLCTVDEAYRRDLSAASERSLALQGGLMTDEEQMAFELEPYFPAALQLRRYDDMGKVPGMRTPPLEAFRETLRSTLISPELF